MEKAETLKEGTRDKALQKGIQGVLPNVKTPDHCLVLDCPTDLQALEGSTVEGFSICWSPVEEVKLSKYKT